MKGITKFIVGMSSALVVGIAGFGIGVAVAPDNAKANPNDQAYIEELENKLDQMIKDYNEITKPMDGAVLKLVGTFARLRGTDGVETISMMGSEDSPSNLGVSDGSGTIYQVNRDIERINKLKEFQSKEGSELSLHLYDTYVLEMNGETFELGYGFENKVIEISKDTVFDISLKLDGVEFEESELSDKIVEGSEYITDTKINYTIENDTVKTITLEENIITHIDEN